MKTKFLYIIILPLLCLASATSCVHEYAVVDNSFEFVADVTYDGGANQHRLTLTRKAGAPDNQYKIAFTLDGESTMTLTDANGMTIEGFFNESFDDVSIRTYTLSTIAPGEHTLDLEITTEEFSQSLAVTFVVGKALCA